MSDINKFIAIHLAMAKDCISGGRKTATEQSDVTEDMSEFQQPEEHE